MTVQLLKPVAEGRRAEIQHEPQNLSVSVTKAVAALSRVDSIYQQDSALVRAERGMSGVVLRELGRVVTRMVLTECVVFKSMQMVAKEFVNKSIGPPDAVVDAVLQCPDRWREAGIRDVTGVSRLPGCDSKGAIIVEGYNQQYRRLIDFDGKAYPKIGSTKADALAAYNRVADLMVDFPFTTDLDRRVAVSLLITAVHRSFMRVCPAYLIDSPSPEIGKSLVVDLASALLNGRRAQTINPTEDQNEMRKSIFSMLMAGSQHVAIDNIDITFGGAPFDILITQEAYPDRKLGVSEMRAPSTVALVTLTGRNVQFKGDGALRTIRAQMSTTNERPGTVTTPRKYPHIFDYVVEHREQLVSDCVTIARAYLLAGRPNPTGLREFDDWCMRVRDPMVWLGQGDIADSIENVRKDSDEIGAMMAELLNAWFAIHGDDPMVLHDLIKEVRNPPTGPDKYKYERLSDAIEAFGIDQEKVNSHNALLKRLRPNIGRTFSGMALNHAPRNKRGLRYAVTAEKKQEAEFTPVDPVDYFAK